MQISLDAKKQIDMIQKWNIEIKLFTSVSRIWGNTVYNTLELSVDHTGARTRTPLA
jgi:hypothetical protein